MEITPNEDKPKKNIWNEIAERALRTGNNVPAVEVEFDVEKALAGLAWNFDRNRRPKPFVIKKFRDIIEDFSFSCGSTIRIAKNESGNWVLIDGQHRLTAIAEAGVKLWMLVVVDSRLARIAYANIDNVGTLRTHKDAVSSILGWSTSWWLSVVSAARLIRAKFSLNSFRGKEKDINPELTASVVEKYRAEFEKIISLDKSTKAWNCMRSSQLAVLAVIAHYQPEIFYPWFQRALLDDMLPRESTEKRLTETFLLPADNVPNKFRLMLSTIFIWNAHYRGESMFSAPRIIAEGIRRTKFPGILGTPFGAE
jgi:hypothetical protein